MLENSDVRGPCSRSGRNDQARAYYQSGRMFPSRGRVLGEGTEPAVLDAPALDWAPEDRPKGCMALTHSSFQASGLPEVAHLVRAFRMGLGSLDSAQTPRRFSLASASNERSFSI